MGTMTDEILGVFHRLGGETAHVEKAHFDAIATRWGKGGPELTQLTLQKLKDAAIIEETGIGWRLVVRRCCPTCGPGSVPFFNVP